MFRKADLVVITKCDMVEYFDFDIDRAIENARKLKPNVEVILLDNKNGEGLDKLIEWIQLKRGEYVLSNTK
jgi:hydrogenase nickel incorporation protein HypB